MEDTFSVDNVASTSAFKKSFCTKLSSNAAHEKNFLKEHNRELRVEWETLDPCSHRKREKKGNEQAAATDDRSGRNEKVVTGSEHRANGRGIIKYRATNPFIIFFLRLRSKKPKEHVTVIARAAGKLWTQMTPEQRKKYIDLANAEKIRREEQKKKRKSRRRWKTSMKNHGVKTERN